MRVLVFEQWTGGHHFHYLKYLLPRLSEIADEVIVTLTARACESDEFRAQLAGACELPRVRIEASVPAADPALRGGERLRVLRHLQDAIRATRPDHVLVPTADAPTLAMAALGTIGLGRLPRGAESEAALHCGYGPAIACLKHRLKESAYRTAFAVADWDRMHFVNFACYELARRRGLRWAHRARLVPDPVPVVRRLERVQARRMLGIPEDGRYLGLLGILDARKAIPELLEAFRAARLGRSDRLLLAGRMQPSLLALVRERHADLLREQRLVLIDRYLHEHELLSGYCALDVACITYRDFPGVASLLLKALAAGRPVIAHDFGWARAVVKRFGVGHTCRVRDPGAFAATLERGLNESGDYLETPAVQRLLEFHTVDNFAESILERIRARAGKPAAVPPRTWEWVLQALRPELRMAY